MKLIIVESPTKTKTLKKFLGKEYAIAATVGHVRDLPKKELGIDIEKDFTPKYVISPKKGVTVYPAFFRVLIKVEPNSPLAPVIKIFFVFFILKLYF